MTLDSISAIQARMAHIQSLVQAPVPVSSRPTSATSSAFASLLADEVARTSSTSSATSSALAGDGVPVALAAYGNGTIPTTALDEVGATGQYLWGPAAQQLERMIGDAGADGVSIGITDGYRTYDAQVRLAQDKGLYSQGGLAAVPGTSEHGWGMAADLSLDSAALAWLRTHGAAYGFEESTPREPWHWSYRP